MSRIPFLPKIQYTFIDTANVDGIGLPEYIVSRDSLINQGSGIDQRGYWSYIRLCKVVEVWSLDREEVLLSFIKSKHHRSLHSNDFFQVVNQGDQNRKMNLNWNDFYEYDLEFKYGEIIIKNLRTSKSQNDEPDFTEGRYHLKNGALRLIEN